MKTPTLKQILPPSSAISKLYPWQQSSLSFSTLPGVYWFKNSQKEILYIGKAKSLKNRIASYHLKTNQTGKTKVFLSQTKHIQYTTVKNELQALILEAKLIKSFKPKYNIRLKDDKSPLYIVITHQDFPRVLTARKKNLLHTPFPLLNIFGPFASAYKTKQILKTLRHIFPYCNLRIKNKACFYTHINLCSGACTGKVTKTKYQQMIKKLTHILKGNNKKVLKSLTKQMKKLSSLKKYEQAAQIRDQINALNNLDYKHWSDIDPQLQLSQLAKLLKLKTKLKRIETYDISNIQGQHATGSMVVFTNALPHKNQYRRFKIKMQKKPDDTGMIKEILTRRIHNSWAKPDLIIIDGGKPQVNAAKKIITHSIPILGIAKNKDRLIYNSKTIKLDPGSPALKLVQHCRDEAHRFAKSYYSYLHQKNLLK